MKVESYGTLVEDLHVVIVGHCGHCGLFEDVFVFSCFDFNI